MSGDVGRARAWHVCCLRIERERLSIFALRYRAGRGELHVLGVAGQAIAADADMCFGHLALQTKHALTASSPSHSGLSTTGVLCLGR